MKEFILFAFFPGLIKKYEGAGICPMNLTSRWSFTDIAR
jgi:hypothetical protein